MLQAFVYWSESYYTDALLKGKNSALTYECRDADLSVYFSSSLKKVNFLVANFESAYLKKNHFNAFEKIEINLRETDNFIKSKIRFNNARQPIQLNIPLQKISSSPIAMSYTEQKEKKQTLSREVLKSALVLGHHRLNLFLTSPNNSYQLNVAGLKRISTPLESGKQLLGKYSQKNNILSYPSFAKTVSKREIKITNWIFPSHKVKIHKLEREVEVSFLSPYTTSFKDEVNLYKTSCLSATKLIAFELKKTPKLFSITQLLKGDQTILPHWKRFSSLRETSSALLPKSSITYKEQIKENNFPKLLWKPQKEPSIIENVKNIEPLEFFFIEPPESGKRALLYPIGIKEYHLLAERRDEGISVQKKESLVKEKFIYAYIIMNQINAPYPHEEPSFFGNSYEIKKATKIDRCFNFLETKKEIDKISQIENLEIINLINIENKEPVASNYLEGITLLNNRTPSSFKGLLEDAKLKNRTCRCIAYGLATFPSLSDTQTEIASDDFFMSTSVIQETKKEGYVFSLRVSLKETAQRTPFRHHLYFLIDRSSSIEHHRFDVFKNAVSSAITSLGEGHLFNIFMFDNKVEVLSPSDLKSSKNSLKMVREFLDKQTQPWLSSSTSLLELLDWISDQTNESDDLYSAILLTNGNSLKTIDQYKEVLKKIINSNKDNFFLHTTAVGPKNQIAILDIIAGLCGGSLLYSPTHAALPRKLSVLTKQIKEPIVTDLRITSLNEDPSIEFYHNPKLSSYLCKNRSFTFIGTTKKLAEFDVLIQGRVDGHWVNIKKHVNLKESVRTHTKLNKELTLQQAYSHCVNFLETGDDQELTFVEDLIKSCGIDSP